MSNVVLSASVRQNLLSLQSTADLLATTQNRLSSGKKVNTALDNPTNFFTAAGLDSRASDINNLLDGIGNGVQILQAANTGITSLNKLIDTAKSIANQALQTPVGYSTKSNVSTSISGATADDLRGTTSFVNTVANSNVLYSGAAGGATPVQTAAPASLLGGISANLAGVAATAGDGTAALSNTIKLIDATGTAATALIGNAQPVDGDTLTVNGNTITFRAGSPPAPAAVASGSGVTGNIVTDGNGNSTVYIGTTLVPLASVADLTKAIDLASGVQKTVNLNGTATVTNSSGTNGNVALGILTLTTGTGSDLNITGKADLLKALGLSNSTGPGTVTVTQQRTTSGLTTGSLIQDGSTLTVDGKTITFVNAAKPLAANVPAGSGVTAGNVVTDGSGNSTVYLQGGNISDVLTAIDLATGVQTATNTSGSAVLQTTAGSTASSVAASGALRISTGTNSDLNISGSGNALAALGLAGNTGTSTVFSAARNAGLGGISGKTLTFTAFNGGTPVNVTFGDGTNGTVKTLAQLNAALLPNNLAATVDATGKLVIAAGNDFASSTLGSVVNGGILGGTVTTTLSFSTASPPVVDLASQSTRSNLVAQYNNIIAQITTTSQDASFNGVNLLAGDTLKLVFNETGKSTLNIVGQQLTPAGLGLPTLVAGTDLVDNNSANKTLAALNLASTTLRSQASSYGSNLSIVQIRQEFAKSLINVLQTGSSNLTLADTNEEAANSQALSTRQSIAVSALALANQSQQSVLKLLQ